MRETLVNWYRAGHTYLTKKGLRYPFLKKINGIVIQKLKSDKAVIDGHTIYLDKDDSMRLSTRGHYEPFVADIAKKYLKEGDIVFDIGANIGYYTIIAGKHIGPEGQVFAYEPEDRNYSLLKKNIEAKVYCPTKTDQNYSKLSGLELLTDTITASDLVVSLEYPLDQIEQVSYNDDGGRLNLVVKTKTGAPKIENNKIIINNDGSNADVCFMLGDESTLGANAGITAKGNWIFISPTNVTKAWAKASIVDPDAPFSEIFTFLLPMIGLELDINSGKDLLIGLRVATQSFSVNVSPESFEAGAVCLRATQPETPAAQAAPAAPIEQIPVQNVEKTGGIPPMAPSIQPNPTPTN